MGENSKTFRTGYKGLFRLSANSVVLFVISAFIVVLVIGCSTVKYHYNNILYNTPEAALQAQRERMNGDLSLITPTENPLGGRVLCVIPSRDLIEKNGIRKFGTPKPEAINYAVSSTELGLDSQSEALRGRKIFDEVRVVKSGDPESVTMIGYELTIYYVMKSPDQVQWFLKVLPNKIPFPIYIDTSLPQGMPRLMDWLKNIEKLSREQLKK